MAGLTGLINTTASGVGVAFGVLGIIAIANGLSTYVMRDGKTLAEVISNRLGA